MKVELFVGNEMDGHLEKLIRREKGIPMDDEMQWLQN